MKDILIPLPETALDLVELFGSTLKTCGETRVCLEFYRHPHAPAAVFHGARRNRPVALT